MQIINTRELFSEMVDRSNHVFDRTQLIPENGFAQHLGLYRFFPFDDIFSESIVKGSRRLAAMDNSEWWIQVIEPDPNTYFHRHYGFFGAFLFSSTDDWRTFLDACGNYPPENCADSLLHNGNILLMHPQSCNWAMIAYRDVNLAIAAFASDKHLKAFEETAALILFPNIREALDYADYGTDGDDEVGQLILENFADARRG